MSKAKIIIEAKLAAVADRNPTCSSFPGQPQSVQYTNTLSGGGGFFMHSFTAKMYGASAVPSPRSGIKKWE